MIIFSKATFYSFFLFVLLAVPFHSAHAGRRQCASFSTGICIPVSGVATGVLQAPQWVPVSGSLYKDGEGNFAEFYGGYLYPILGSGAGYTASPETQMRLAVLLHNWKVRGTPVLTGEQTAFLESHPAAAPANASAAVTPTLKIVAGHYIAKLENGEWRVVFTLPDGQLAIQDNPQSSPAPVPELTREMRRQNLLNQGYEAVENHPNLLSKNGALFALTDDSADPKSLHFITQGDETKIGFNDESTVYSGEDDVKKYYAESKAKLGDEAFNKIMADHKVDEQFKKLKLPETTATNNPPQPAPPAPIEAPPTFSLNDKGDLIRHETGKPDQNLTSEVYKAKGNVPTEVWNDYKKFFNELFSKYCSNHSAVTDQERDFITQTRQLFSDLIKFRVDFNAGSYSSRGTKIKGGSGTHHGFGSFAGSALGDRPENTETKFEPSSFALLSGLFLSNADHSTVAACQFKDEDTKNTPEGNLVGKCWNSEGKGVSYTPELGKNCETWMNLGLTGPALEQKSSFACTYQKPSSTRYFCHVVRDSLGSNENQVAVPDNLKGFIDPVKDQDSLNNMDDPKVKDLVGLVTGLKEYLALKKMTEGKGKFFKQLLLPLGEGMQHVDKPMNLDEETQGIKQMMPFILGTTGTPPVTLTPDEVDSISKAAAQLMVASHERVNQFKLNEPQKNALIENMGIAFNYYGQSYEEGRSRGITKGLPPRSLGAGPSVASSVDGKVDADSEGAISKWLASNMNGYDPKTFTVKKTADNKYQLQFGDNHLVLGTIETGKQEQPTTKLVLKPGYRQLFTFKSSTGKPSADDDLELN